MRNSFTRFLSQNQKIQQSNEEQLSNVSTAKVVLKMLTTKQNRTPGIPLVKCGEIVFEGVSSQLAQNKN
jgi:hypothetical protein